MSKNTDSSELASELERLITDLSESGPLLFVFGVGWWTAHLDGVTAPVFRGPADRRRWHVELGGGAADGQWTCGSMRSPGSGSSARLTRSLPFLGGRP
jgi:hypothetical protein